MKRRIKRILKLSEFQELNFFPEEDEGIMDPSLQSQYCSGVEMFSNLIKYS
jgi:hypothetical protein